MQHRRKPRHDQGPPAPKCPHQWLQLSRHVRSLRWVPGLSRVLDTIPNPCPDEWHSRQAALFADLRNKVRILMNFANINFCAARLSVAHQSTRLCESEDILMVFASRFCFNNEDASTATLFVKNLWGTAFTLEWEIGTDEQLSIGATALFKLMRSDDDDRVVPHLREHWKSAVDMVDNAARANCKACIDKTSLHSEQRVLMLSYAQLRPLVTALRFKMAAAQMHQVDTIVLDVASERDVCSHCGMLLAASTTASDGIFAHIESMLGLAASGGHAKLVRVSGSRDTKARIATKERDARP